ncbi:MAG: hypothetical protein AAFU79_11300 [Myxococcota bacterium]
MRRKTRRRSWSEWQQLVEEWQRSGLSANAFAARGQLNPSTLTWWKWRLGAEADAPAKVAPIEADLRPVEIVDVEQYEVPDGWELHGPSGEVLRVRGELTAAQLAQILAALTHGGTGP